MAKGVIGGLLAGGLVSAVGLAAASLVDDLSQTAAGAENIVASQPEPATMDQPADATAGATMDDGPSLAPAPETAATPGVDAPQVDTTPPEAPETTGVEGDMDAPDIAEPDAPELQEDDPVLPSPQAAAPEVPASEANIVVDQTPATENGEEVFIVVSPDEDASPEEAEMASALISYGATPVDVTADKQMSFLLLDTGEVEAPLAPLDGLPFPVTIALSANVEASVERFTAYRAAGFEVMLVVPAGGEPVSLDDYPENIGVFAAGSADDLSPNELAMLASTGRGAVLADGDLSADMGVPTAKVSYELDADGQDARVIRRFLSTAEETASGASGVIAASLRPDTLAAMILWGATRSTDQVTIVPVSQLILDTSPLFAD